MHATPDPGWGIFANFLRKLSHDVCNELNGLDLEAVLLADCVSAGEGAESVARMRAQIRRLAGNLRGIVARFAEPKPVRALYPACELFLIWTEQPAALDPAPAVAWREFTGSQQVEVDASALATVFLELLDNAQAFGTGAPLAATVRTDGGRVAFELREPKDAPLDPSHWGSQPFESSRRGHYGLGLWVAHRIVAASGGIIARSFAPETMELITTLSFPAA